MFNDLVVINAIANTILCVIIVLWDTYFYFKVNETERWAKLLYIFVGVVWLIRYILFFLDYDGYGKANANPVLLMVVSITLLALAVGSIIRVQKLCGSSCLVKDIKTIVARIKWIFRRH